MARALFKIPDIFNDVFFSITITTYGNIDHTMKKDFE